MSERAPDRPDVPGTPPLTHNLVSLAGIIVAAGSLFAVILLFAMDFSGGGGSPYVGILTYMVAPAFLVGGLLAVAVGALIERRCRRKRSPSEIPRFPKLDLNDPRQRRTTVVISVAAIVFLLLTAVGSYQTYHFTESVRFCGTTCHEVMEPEFTAYRNSPHARVACVECHIGPGAGWYVKSKLSGAYQVYATLANIYPRPIPTPIENLRPAQETCEQCHWPLQFYDNAERVNVHFRTNEDNDPWTIRLLVKIGGGDPDVREVRGIHWHVGATNVVEYIATDHSRQEIPWVRVVGADSQVTVYQAADTALTPSQIDSAVPRRMDCIDCHNRPTHIFQPPKRALNLAMSSGRLDTDLPFIKRNASELLTAEYETAEQALQAIEDSLMSEYQNSAGEQAVRQAVRTVQDIYRNNFFPEMKVDWRVYPNNIGHTLFTGCYRCHDGKHTSTSGEAIVNDCRSCHIIIAQGSETDSVTVSRSGLEFEHPVDISGMWRQVNCAVCHTGGGS